MSSIPIKEMKNLQNIIRILVYQNTALFSTFRPPFSSVTGVTTFLDNLII